MRTLHNDNAQSGFAVLAFPCNQFGSQEPGTGAEILEFAKSTYDVNFPMFAKVSVNGPDACDLYVWLKEQQGATDITWNFEKFLVDRKGVVVARFSPRVTPEEIALELPNFLG